jgi:acyl-CoA hydrolase
VTKPHLWYGDGPDAPRTNPAHVLAAAGYDDVEPRLVTLGWTIEQHEWIDDASFEVRTVLAGYGLARAVNDGRVTALTVRLSAVPSMIDDHPPDVAVLTGVRRGNELAFGVSVGWNDVLARSAQRVVVEIDDDGVDLGAPIISGNIVATIERPRSPTADQSTSRPADNIDLQIGSLVASWIPDDATLQFGPGGIGEGIARSLDRPVRIWSGLVTDAMAEVHERGYLRAPLVATYAWGGAPIRRLASDEMLRLVSCTETHDLTALSNTPRFVGCNTALQVGLDGSVNVEMVGGRLIAAVGGHSDFCTAASRSVGGLSIIAVRSQTAKGASTIVAAVDRVSTQRSDVDLVVTEHGIADLRAVGDRERAERMISVAAPEHREQLRRSMTPGGRAHQERSDQSAGSPRSGS